MQGTRPLDATDHRIVALLQANAKDTFGSIGSKVGLSAAAVKRRVDRLQRDGVIVGYTARVDARRLGASAVEALIEVYACDHATPADVAHALESIGEIWSAFTVSGEPDAVIRVRVDSTSHLEQVVERLLRDPTFVRTRTLTVLSTIIDRYG